MSNSKTIQLGQREMALINADQSPIALIDEIRLRHDQASGVIGLLCGFDSLKSSDCVPDRAVSLAAFGLAETMQEIETLTSMLYKLACNQDKPQAA